MISCEKGTLKAHATEVIHSSGEGRFRTADSSFVRLHTKNSCQDGNYRFAPERPQNDTAHCCEKLLKVATAQTNGKVYANAEKNG